MITRRKGRRYGAAMTVWMFFANLFDPKKAVAIEQIETQKRIGQDAARVVRAAASPPPGDVTHGA